MFKKIITCLIFVCVIATFNNNAEGKNIKPEISNIKIDKSECWKPESENNCKLQSLKVKNKNFKKTELIFNCGENYENIKFIVEPRISQIINIYLEEKQQECNLVSWQVLKK